MKANKLTNIQFIILEFFLTRSLFAGIGYSRMYQSSNKDTWLCMILGTLIGVFIIYIFHLNSKKIKNNLNNKKFINWLYKTATFLLYLLFIFTPILIIEV